MFRKGDRVRCIVDYPDNNRNIRIGDAGTVCDNLSYLVRVRWDHQVDGHDCAGHCEDGYGWNVFENELEYLEYDDSEEEIDEQKFLTMLDSDT